MNKLLSINKVSLVHDGVTIIDNVSFDLEKGHIGCLLGPSGSGKTSLLRCITGFYPLRRGSIHIDNLLVSTADTRVEPENRQVGMVFQDYALFPHLTVTGNIGFGIRKMPGKTRTKRIETMLELTGLGDFRKQYPHELSGGQQQRVAVARALAPEPKLLLLDEPFSSLDAELRLQLVEDIRSVIIEHNTTALLVTHNQDEAFAMSDMLGVLHCGRLLQWDSAYDIYHKPKSRKVATFIGLGSMIKGEVIGSNRVRTVLGDFPSDTPITNGDAGRTVKVLIRPDDIIHDDAGRMQAVIEKKQFRGAEFLYQLKLKSGESVYCFAPSHHNHRIGEAIGIITDIEHVIVFPDYPEIRAALS